jgi:hypothetical protein
VRRFSEPARNATRQLNPRRHAFAEAVRRKLFAMTRRQHHDIGFGPGFENRRVAAGMTLPAVSFNSTPDNSAITPSLKLSLISLGEVSSEFSDGIATFNIG